MDPNISNPQNPPSTPTVSTSGQAPPLAPQPTPKLDSTKKSIFSIIAIIVFVFVSILIVLGGYFYIVQQTQVEEIDLSSEAEIN